MLKVTADIFSGRPNPSWLLEENEAQEVLKEIASNRGVVADMDSGHQGLGYRGMILESLADDTTEKYGIPPVFQIANGTSLYESKGLEIAERLIGSMSQARSMGVLAELNEGLQSLLLEQLGTLSTKETPGEADLLQRGEAMAVEAVEKVTVCYYDPTPFNPAFWNDANMRCNNCYNYATNRRTNTFAQPGWATGYTLPFPPTCDTTTKGALSDGAHKRYDCFPDSERNRNLVALVIWPGQDYHWYRYHSNGFWGHKPGRTAAKNTDDSNNVIANPETCNRGPYTIFCGYFYTPKSIKVAGHGCPP